MFNSDNKETSVTSLSYKDLREKVKPGDVIVFSTTDIPSNVVKLATKSHYVHVAIVHSVYPGDDTPDSILIAESHIDTSLPSVGRGDYKIGVQLQWLWARLKSQDGLAWWAPLKTPLTNEGLSKMQAWLYKIEKEGISYDFIQAVGVGLDSFFGNIGLKNTTDDSALFCSELVTRALQIAGVVDDSINASGLTPGKVMEFTCFQETILIKEK